MILRMVYLRCLLIGLCLTGCQSTPRGVPCLGVVETLYGEQLGQSKAMIEDNLTQFVVRRNGTVLSTGPLYSRDPQHYIPTATTDEGLVAQRMSARRFRLIDPQQERMVTWTCP